MRKLSYIICACVVGVVGIIAPITHIGAYAAEPPQDQYFVHVNVFIAADPWSVESNPPTFWAFGYDDKIIEFGRNIHCSKISAMYMISNAVKLDILMPVGWTPESETVIFDTGGQSSFLLSPTTWDYGANFAVVHTPNAGYNDGYNDGYIDGETDATTSWQGLIPSFFGSIAGFFMTIFSISIWGVSVGSLVAAIGVVLLLIIIVKAIRG